MEGGNEPLRPGINRTDPERQDEGPEPSPWLTDCPVYRDQNSQAL